MKVTKWSVTYTKHIKQKRKVYQDGILKLSGGKVVLYDDCEKLIDSRFLKKDELVECGGMLVFDGHLVDIGDPEKGRMPSADLDRGGEDVELKERAGAHTRKPFQLGNKKRISQYLPSKNYSNVVHESKKVKEQTEQYGAVALQRGAQTTLKADPQKEHTGVACANPDDGISTTNNINSIQEWNALYTTQKTQKAKKYHDGILQLFTCSSHMKQAILLKEDRTVLGSQYLKPNECVKTGQTREFPYYLIEICEQKTPAGGTVLTENPNDTPRQPLEEVAGSRSTCKDKLINNKNDHSGKSLLKDIQKGHLVEVKGYANSSSERSTSINYRPICNVSQILSSLKRPVHTPQSSNTILLDVDNKNKLPECKIRKSVEDNHIGNISMIISDYQWRPASHEYSVLSNRLSGATPHISAAKLDTKSNCIKDQFPTNTTDAHEILGGNDFTLANGVEISSSGGDKLSYRQDDKISVVGEIASPSSSPEDNTDANKKTSIADQIMTLQQEWTSLSHRVLTLGDIKSTNSSSADDRCEIAHPLSPSSHLCVPTDPRSANSELQSESCLDVDEFPTFDLGFG